MIITDTNGNNSNGNERENAHKDFCGEHPPALIPMTNNLSGRTDIIAVRAQCVRNCSRFCEICDCCKFKCGHVGGHVAGSAAYEDDEDDEEEDFGLDNEIFDAGKN